MSQPYFLPVWLRDHSVTTYSCHTLGAAARKLGVSESTIRRVARRLGVTRVAGPAVGGFVVWPLAHGGRHDVILPICKHSFESRPEYQELFAAASRGDRTAAGALGDWLTENT